MGLVGGVHAAGGGIAWDKAPNKTNDMVALQNGAKAFVNYCQNCHAAAYMRFNRLKDLGLTDQQIKDNLLFSTEKIGETLRSLDMAVIRYRNSAEPPHFYLGHLNGPAIGTCDEAINLRRNAILGSANLRAQIELVFGVAA